MTMSPPRLIRLLILALVAAGAGCALGGPTSVTPAPDGGQPARTFGERPKGPEYAAPQLAIGQEGSLYLIWLAFERGKSWDVLLARSEDFGATWSPPRSLKPDKAAVAGGIRIATSPTGPIYVVWHQRDQAASPRKLRLLRSTDKGVHWDDLFQGLKSAQEVPGAQIVTDQDGGVSTAWLVWEKDHRALEVVTAPDPGTTELPTPIRLSAAFPTSQYSIVTHGFTSDGKGSLYVIWEEIKAATDHRIYLNRSVDRSKTWVEQPILVSAAEDQPHMAHRPKILAVPQGQVYVVWEQHEYRPGRDYVPGEVMKPDRLIYVNRSLDYGRTWLPRPVRVNTIREELVQSSNAQISPDRRGHLYVTWVEEDAKRGRLLVARSTDLGVTWSRPTRLDLTSPFAGHLGLPEIQSDEGGHVWVLWQELTEKKTWQLLMNRSTDHGQTWQRQATVLSGRRHGGGSFRGVAFQHDGTGRLYVAWDGGPENDREIYATRSTDFGVSWPPPEVLVGQRSGPGLSESGGGEAEGPRVALLD
ncbi:MAG: exo-alpha-sialidase [candidate division NC10 bacterium]|nr:exo-alpha-sialidase [candidate division NC10 bacterium]